MTISKLLGVSMAVSSVALPQAMVKADCESYATDLSNYYYVACWRTNCTDSGDYECFASCSDGADAIYALAYYDCLLNGGC